MREIAKELGLAGASSAAYIIDSLVKDGYIEKVGIATSKDYKLTDEALKIIPEILSKYVTTNHEQGFFEQNNKIETILNTNEKFPKFLSPNNGSVDSGGDNGLQILSKSITQIISNPITLEKYGEIIIFGTLLLIALPVSRYSLGSDWFIGFICTAVILSLTALLIICLKK